MDSIEMLQEIVIAKEKCAELGIDWDDIDCGYEPSVMQYWADEW